jgi:FkbM family methyltransferase
MFEYKTTNGTIFNLRRNTFDSGVIMESWWLKSYTRHLRNVPSDAVIIDIGAHIGAFSLLTATKYTQSHIFAFEPSFENFALLNKNIKTNNLEKRISSFNIAVTDGKKKSITLNLHPSNLGMHSVVFDYNLGEKGKRHGVPTTSLDRIFSENKIKKCHLLKLDCEGAEYSILFAAPKKLLEKIKNGWDLACGWRKERRDSSLKVFPSKIFNLLTSFFWGTRLHDYNCGLKAFKRDAAKSLRLYGGMHRFIPLLIHQEGFKVTEVPVVHSSRKFGKSKFGFSKILKDFPDMFTMLFLNRYSKRPLHFFGLAGGLLFTIGIIILGYLVTLRFQGETIGRRPLLFSGCYLFFLDFRYFLLASWRI